MKRERILIVVVSTFLLPTLALVSASTARSFRSFQAHASDPGAASDANSKAGRRYIQLPRPASNVVLKRAPFSDGVLVGDTLYLAGNIGLDPKTGKPAATPQEEAHLALDGIKATLEQAGMTMDDLVYVQVYCSDVSFFEEWNTVYRGYFKGDFPARAFLGSGKLLFGARFEVQGIAVKR
jgi:reactive intermediate/imine deaminase